MYCRPNGTPVCGEGVSKFPNICFSQLSRNQNPCDIPLNTAWLIVILMLAYHHHIYVYIHNTMTIYDWYVYPIASMYGTSIVGRASWMESSKRTEDSNHHFQICHEKNTHTHTPLKIQDPGPTFNGCFWFP